MLIRAFKRFLARFFYSFVGSGCGCYSTLEPSSGVPESSPDGGGTAGPAGSSNESFCWSFGVGPVNGRVPADACADHAELPAVSPEATVVADGCIVELDVGWLRVEVLDVVTKSGRCRLLPDVAVVYKDGGGTFGVGRRFVSASATMRSNLGSGERTVG